MTRLAILSLPAVLICSIAFASQEDEHAATTTSQEALKAHNIGNREEPTDTQLLVIAKSFCVQMRHHDESVSIRELGLSYIDPRYLEKHGLSQDEFHVRTIPLVPTAQDDIEVAADRRTIACYMGTGEDQREIILFRTTLHEGNLYFLPAEPPDPKSGLVTPWILRMKLQTR